VFRWRVVEQRIEGWVEVDGQMIDPIHLVAGLGDSPVKGVGARRH
jgi:hypothetical protein